MFGFRSEAVIESMSGTNPGVSLWGVGTARGLGDESGMTSLGRVREPDVAEKLGERAKRYVDLTAFAASLFDECRRLKAENEDLHASAAIWIRLYEQQLERAKALEQQLHPTPNR